MNRKRTVSRLQLLASASALALAIPVCSSAAYAGDAPLWIEIGWHSDTATKRNDDFFLPFGNVLPLDTPAAPSSSGLDLSRSPGDEGKISFRPEGTNWNFWASIRYGRARGGRSTSNSQPIPTTTFVTYHTSIPAIQQSTSHVQPVVEKSGLVDYNTITAEKHFMIDFEAGKDVGLGALGRATIGAGVRFAQLDSSLNVSQFEDRGNIHFAKSSRKKSVAETIDGYSQIVPQYIYGYNELWNDARGQSDSAHNFSGVGPEISWDAATRLAGNRHASGEWSLDWGVNVAILFGKQKNRMSYQTTNMSNCAGRFGGINGGGGGGAVGQCANYPKQYAHNDIQNRSGKSVTVPNAGGFVGFSYRLADFKASLGYRADFFFHAIDSGIAGEHALTRGFQGPFATISFGVGG